MATPVSGVNDWLTLNDASLSFDVGSTNLHADVQEYHQSYFRITTEAPDDITIYIDGELLETERYGRWYWTPEGFAGLYDIEVSAPGQGRQQTQVRVFPCNVSLRQQEQMLQDITNISADLLFQLQSPAKEYAGITRADNYQSPLRSYRLIENLIGDLESAIALIARAPHRVLVGRQEHRQWHELALAGANAIAVPGPAVAMPHARLGVPAILPREWAVERGELTHDVYENRLLKQFLWRQLLPRLIQVEDSAHEEIRRRQQHLAFCKKRKWKDQITEETTRIAELEQAIDYVQSVQRKVISWGNLPFLRWVRLSSLRATPTQVLQKDPGYNQFYSVYLRFQHELRRGVTAERFLTQMVMRKMSELYEMWGVFRLTDVLLPLLKMEGYQVVSEAGFFRLEDQLFHFEVDRDAAIELVKGKTHLFIRYESTYPHLKDGVTGLVTTRYPWLTPDLAVERWEDGVPQAILIFDPKYKSTDHKGQRTYWEEDLNKMSVYYTEILWKDPATGGRPQQIVTSAYILYPGEVLVHNKDFPRVGALPVVPELDRWRNVRQVLIDLLRNGGVINGGSK